MGRTRYFDYSPSLATLYAVFYDRDTGQTWDSVAGAVGATVVANWANYAIPVPEAVAGSGRYSVTIPAAIGPRWVGWTVYQRAGATAAATDAKVAYGDPLPFDGTNIQDTIDTAGRTNLGRILDFAPTLDANHVLNVTALNPGGLTGPQAATLASLGTMTEVDPGNAGLARFTAAALATALTATETNTLAGLAGMLENDPGNAGLARFTVAALANAATGGGGGGLTAPQATIVAGLGTLLEVDPADATKSRLTPAAVGATLEADVEPGITALQALSIHGAALGGVLTGVGTGTITIKGLNTNATRIVATKDANGNRTAVVLTPP